VKLLILGGTLFLGRHLVDAARRRRHRITLFNRGQTAPDLYPDVEQVRGDRDGGLGALSGRRWDAVIDTSGYVPRIVRASALALADRVGHYTFVSSISVYAEPLAPGADESAPIARIPDETTEEVTGESYGALKALCERAAEEAMPGRTLIARPGLIVGPHDPTDRFTYWPRRVARGGDVLAPDDPNAPVQLVDARDLAEWLVHTAETRRTGVYNSTGPSEPLTLGAVLDECRRAIGARARWVWADEEFLLAQGVKPWTELPLWVARGDRAIDLVDCRKAWSAGLTFRPLAETIRDTFAWDRATPAEARPRKTGVQAPPTLTAARESELLDAWRGRAGAAIS